MSQSTATSAEKQLAIRLCSKIVSRWKFHVGCKAGVPCHLAVLDACQELRLPVPTWVAVEAGNRVTQANNKQYKKRMEAKSK